MKGRRACGTAVLALVQSKQWKLNPWDFYPRWAVVSALSGRLVSIGQVFWERRADQKVARRAPDLSAGISGQPDSAGTGAVLLLRGRRLRIKRWLCSCVAGGHACPKLCSLYPCQADIPYKFCLTRRATYRGLPTSLVSTELWKYQKRLLWLKSFFFFLAFSMGYFCPSTQFECTLQCMC